MTKRILTWMPVVMLIIATGIPNALSAQKVVAAEQVVSVSFGDGGGRGGEFLPDNVLGRPDTAARPSIPATNPNQILSLGRDGEIILSFGNYIVVDSAGDDFTVFENPFVYKLGGTNRVYAEPGEVSVSQDGLEWFTFPIDSTTLEGAAGVTPTDGQFNPTTPKAGGDSFDLADLGISSIRFVRIRDVTSIVLGNRSHPFYDPTLNGFDLDAVVARHATFEALGVKEDSAIEELGLDLW